MTLTYYSCTNHLKKWISISIMISLSLSLRSSNASNTEIILFRPKIKTITKHLNFRISGQKVNIVKQTKYLGIYLNEHLTWTFQLDQIKSKLSRSCVFCNFWLNLKICNTSLVAVVASAIEIKQLMKLNKFKERPSELCPSNQKMKPPILYFENW